MALTELRQWCLVGNVGGLRPVTHEPGGLGTRHFSMGTKVYCFPAQWGDGYRKIYVIGRHRGSGTYARLVMPSALISNWRVQLVYSPALVHSINAMCAESGRTSWQSREQVEAFLLELRSSRALSDAR